MADKCTSFLDLLSFPFTSLVCKSLFIFPVFWTLTKWNQFKLSFLSAITISYFWTRHLCITHCFSTLSVLSHTVALSQHICCLQNFLLDCHIMPQTIFCILKTLSTQPRTNHSLFVNIIWEVACSRMPFLSPSFPYHPPPDCTSSTAVVVYIYLNVASLMDN